jgi:Icc-related predicted phosphoesterase
VETNLRIACISDTHRQHTDYTDELKAGGFLLVHTGDADCSDERTWQTFIAWAKKVSKHFKHGMVFVPGNHDTYVQENLDECREELVGTRIHLLINESVEFEGFRVFGSPYVLPTGHPAYNAFTTNGEALENIWESVPADLDLLATHGPASGILDDYYGDPWLFEAIRSKRPKLHVFGHIHGQAGSSQRHGTLHVNAAIIGTINMGPYMPTWIDYDLAGRLAVASALIVMDVT